MTAEEFDILLGMVGPVITKQHTQMRRAISPKEHLAVTIRFLATGGSGRAIFDLTSLHFKCVLLLYIL